MNTDDTHRKNVEEILLSVRNAKRVFRDEGADAILRQPELIPCLIDFVYAEKKADSIKAAWILELVCLFEIRLLLPYLSEFTARLGTLTRESAIRPASKISSLVCQHYEKHPWEETEQKAHWKEDIIEASFDWLTGDHKIAAQCFAMESLWLLGKDSDWVLDELYSVLDKEYPKRSPGYQSRARKIMDKISAAKRKKY